MLGVGSTHCVESPPEQSWHAAWHGLHRPLYLSAYWPGAQLETQRPWSGALDVAYDAPMSRVGKTRPSGQELCEHALGTHEVHCVAAGPLQLWQRPWHGWQTRASSA